MRLSPAALGQRPPGIGDQILARPDDIRDDARHEAVWSSSSTAASDVLAATPERVAHGCRSLRLRSDHYPTRLAMLVVGRPLPALRT
jgi:hypothetical protein